ncbi:hypothetical protein [Neorhizobium sp. LjRoot104]|uniref:hypothetical protein n=1 Tax=Neorhizobium sp. LjRoot104 TaxID=3342254 RepID=UPI003ECF1634
MTVFKIKNPSHSKHPIHTVDGVRHIGARLTREFDLSGPGEKLVRASEVLQLIEPASQKARKSTQRAADAETDSEASDVHGEGDTASAGGSEEGGGGAQGSL